MTRGGPTEVFGGLALRDSRLESARKAPRRSAAPRTDFVPGRSRCASPVFDRKPLLCLSALKDTVVGIHKRQGAASAPCEPRKPKEVRCVRYRRACGRNGVPHSTLVASPNLLDCVYVPHDAPPIGPNPT